MVFNIRKMVEGDRACVVDMMQRFYGSPAVSTNGSLQIFNTDIDYCINDSPYLEGYVFEAEGLTFGYGMLAKSFSTEFGKPCVWIEDIFVEENFRKMGVGSNFLKFVERKYPTALLRLEVECENQMAVSVYKKRGFDFLPYKEMKK